MNGEDLSESGLEALVAAFLDRTLPAAAWTHHAHLLTGLILARRLPEPDLLPSLRSNIRAYNLASGGQNTAEAGYHEAITAFYGCALAAFARATRHLPASEAAERLLAGPLADRKIALRAYDERTLKTSQARLDGAAPDRVIDYDLLAFEALSGFVMRLATPDDIPALKVLMHDAITRLLQPFLSPDMVEASREIMGLDTQLISDGTYFVVSSGDQIVGCGGWSRRATLFGGDHSAGRSAALLDPAVDPARVRAMYTRPGCERRGIGRLVLAACESAAAAEGFETCELAATLGGEPLYQACGYAPVANFTAPTSGGLEIPLIRMRKALIFRR